MARHLPAGGDSKRPLEYKRSGSSVSGIIERATPGVKISGEEKEERKEKKEEERKEDTEEKEDGSKRLQLLVRVLDEPSINTAQSAIFARDVRLLIRLIDLAEHTGHDFVLKDEDIKPNIGSVWIGVYVRTPPETTYFLVGFMLADKNLMKNTLYVHSTATKFIKDDTRLQLDALLLYEMDRIAQELGARYVRIQRPSASDATLKLFGYKLRVTDYVTDLDHTGVPLEVQKLNQLTINGINRVRATVADVRVVHDSELPALVRKTREMQRELDTMRANLTRQRDDISVLRRVLTEMEFVDEVETRTVSDEEFAPEGAEIAEQEDVETIEALRKARRSARSRYFKEVISDEKTDEEKTDEEKTGEKSDDEKREVKSKMVRKIDPLGPTAWRYCRLSTVDMISFFERWVKYVGKHSSTKYLFLIFDAWARTPDMELTYRYSHNAKGERVPRTASPVEALVQATIGFYKSACRWLRHEFWATSMWKQDRDTFRFYPSAILGTGLYGTVFSGWMRSATGSSSSSGSASSRLKSSSSGDRELNDKPSIIKTVVCVPEMTSAYRASERRAVAEYLIQTTFAAKGIAPRAYGIRLCKTAPPTCLEVDGDIKYSLGLFCIHMDSVDTTLHRFLATNKLNEVESEYLANELNRLLVATDAIGSHNDSHLNNIGMRFETKFDKPKSTRSDVGYTLMYIDFGRANLRPAVADAVKEKFTEFPTLDPDVKEPYNVMTGMDLTRTSKREARSNNDDDWHRVLNLLKREQVSSSDYRMKRRLDASLPKAPPLDTYDFLEKHYQTWLRSW